ncbi:MAG: heme o synthase [Acidobacteria bacterium]|nr:heme o synthase [Acidobacteriota bacterium]
MAVKSVPAPSSPPTLDVPAVSAHAHSRAADFLALTKPRLNFLVVVTALAAYVLGADAAAPLLVMVNTVIGTALVAGGASALNQVWEQQTDALMRRTRMRPLPDRRLLSREAMWFGTALCLVGLVVLWFGTNPLATAVAGLTAASYVLCYTPLKTRTSLSTIVGAVPGALPAVIGWTAATETWSIEAWVLFGIVFMWQMPHFLAIAWMYRDDYARAGIPLLPVLEPDGGSTGRQAVLYTAALIPISFLPTLVGLAGARFLSGAIVLDLVLLWLAIEFGATRTMPSARRLFAAMR